jgi:PhzF family phenazine biosynthesis protein
LRWFTPETEVDLCGHATLAAAWLLFQELSPELKTVHFETRSGTLTVHRGQDGLLDMSMPADPIQPFAGPDGLKEALGKALGAPPPDELFKGRYLVAIWRNPKIVRGLKGPGEIAPVIRKLGFWGLVVSAPGDADYDVVSRFFAPDKGVPEDPVTGSAHCALVPFWAKRLGRSRLRARQASPRGGDLLCTDDGERVILSGTCALYLRGEIEV